MVKHKLLMKRHVLRSHLPETHWHTAKKAVRMLKKYSTIFIKPNDGSGGTGIKRIRRSSHGYEIRSGQKRKYVGSASLYKAVRAYQGSSKKYIVQKGIKLARYKGKIFDIRMYLQKPSSGWTISGMAARIAAPHRIVTNKHQGGYGKTLERVLLRVFENNRSKVKRCIKKLRKISIITANTLDKRFSDIRELGIDIGIDRDGHVWIIEANSRPMHKLFTQLRNKKMLHKIRKIKRIIRH
jgi:glutathione synthase/RimK-type ligase-like ATP-grasp enzyme